MPPRFTRVVGGVEAGQLASIRHAYVPDSSGSTVTAGILLSLPINTVATPQ